MPRVKIKKLPKLNDGGSPFNAGSVNNSQPLRKIDKPINEVNKTLKPIPREDANIEVEKGEVVITNFLGDGIPESYVAGGKRHNQGGTPIWADENSFIFSDYKTGRKKGEKGLKINDPKILELFDIKLSKKTKKGITPAQIAKKYELNTYKKQLLDPNSDHITQTTAEEMIANNIDKLGLLSLVQESMKGFPDGIPHLAIPFLQARGIDPQMFLPEQEEEQMAQSGQAEPMQQPMQQPISQTAPSPEMNMAAQPMMARMGGNKKMAKRFPGLDIARSGGLYKAQPGVGINDNMQDELLTARQRRRENRRFNRFAAEHAENRFREASERKYWDDDAFKYERKGDMHPRDPLLDPSPYFEYTPDSDGLRSYLWNKYDWYKGQDDPTTEINEEQAIWDELKESGSFAPLAQRLNLTPKQVKEIEADMETYFQSNPDLYTDGDYNFSRKNKRKFQSSQGDDPRFQWRDEDKRYDWSTFETDDDENWYDIEGQDPNDPTFKEGYWDQTRENWDNTLGRRPKNLFQRIKQKRDLNQILKNPNLYPQQNNQNQGIQFNVDDQGNISNRQSGGSLYKAQSGFDTQPTNTDGTSNDNYWFNSNTNKWEWNPYVDYEVGSRGYYRTDTDDFLYQDRHDKGQTRIRQHDWTDVQDTQPYITRTRQPEKWVSKDINNDGSIDPHEGEYEVDTDWNETSPGIWSKNELDVSYTKDPTTGKWTKNMSGMDTYQTRFNELEDERLKYVGFSGKTNSRGEPIMDDGTLVKKWKADNPGVPLNQKSSKYLFDKDSTDPSHKRYYENIKETLELLEELDPEYARLYANNLSGSDEIADYIADHSNENLFRNKLGTRQINARFALTHDPSTDPCPPCPGETVSKPRNDDGTCPECDTPDTPKDTPNIPNVEYEDPKFPKKEYWNQDIFRMAALMGRMPRKEDRDYVPFNFKDRDVVGLSPDQMIHAAQASEAAFNNAIRSTRGTTSQKQAQMLGNVKTLPEIEKAIGDIANKNVAIFDTYERDMMNQNYNEEIARQKNLDDYLADWNTIDDNYWKRKNIWKDSMANAYLDAESNALDTYYLNMENPNFQIRPSRGGRASFSPGWYPGQGSSSSSAMSSDDFITEYKKLNPSADGKDIAEAWAKYVTSLNKRSNMSAATSYNPFTARRSRRGTNSIYDLYNMDV